MYLTDPSSEEETFTDLSHFKIVPYRFQTNSGIGAIFFASKIGAVATMRCRSSSLNDWEPNQGAKKPVNR